MIQWTESLVAQWWPYWAFKWTIGTKLCQDDLMLYEMYPDPLECAMHLLVVSCVGDWFSSTM